MSLYSSGLHSLLDGTKYTKKTIALYQVEISMQYCSNTKRTFDSAREVDRLGKLSFRSWCKIFLDLDARYLFVCWIK